jgi:protein-tyrosine phosphatase
MFDYLMTPEQLKLRDETRELVKSLPRVVISLSEQHRYKCEQHQFTE